MSDVNTSGKQVIPGKLLRTVILLVIACGIMGAMIYKAAIASMTHDESSTYLNLVEGSTLNLWSCHSNPACWTTANNHLLNTLLMRWSAKIFSPTEVTLRLPNLLLLVIYLLSVVAILKETVTTAAEAVFGIALMTCNPFVLDFFALARGYGMGLGLTTLSIYGAWVYFMRNRAGYCVLAFAAATAAVFTNLTYLAFVAALMAAITVHLIDSLLRHPQRPIAGIIPLSMTGCLLLLFGYFYRPVMILIGLGEFEYGASTLWDSWEGFARDSIYGVTWIGEKTVRIAATASAVLVGLCAIGAWIPIHDDNHATETRVIRFLSVLFVALIAFLVFSHVFTGAYYPSGRKAIMLFSPAALLVFFVIRKYCRRARMIGQMFMAAAGIFIVSHFIRAYDSHSYREWWYDASTKDMVYVIAAKAVPGSPVSLAVEWIFHPSSQFYIQTKDLPIALAPYSKEISQDLLVDYYYVHPEHAGQLDSLFILEKDFNGRYLMKRR